MEETKVETPKLSLNDFLLNQRRDRTKLLEISKTLFFFNPEEFIDPCYDHDFFPTEQIITNKNIVLQTFQAKKVVIEPVFFMTLNLFNIRLNIIGKPDEYFMGKVIESPEGATYYPGCYIFFQRKTIFDVIENRF